MSHALSQVLIAGMVATLAVAASPVAAAQSIKPYQGEIVMTRAGQLVAPWKETTACYGEAGACKIAVYNPKTREIARLGDRWATKFEATGNGSEVRRAETTMQKAIRLDPGYIAPKAATK